MLVVITGLRAEARIARPLGIALAGGGTARGANIAVDEALGMGATSLLSVGLAGGLDPSLQAGGILLPRVVLVGAAALPVDTALRARLGSGDGRPLLGGEETITDRAEKSKLYGQTGAAGVDLESAAVARAATGRGLPFAVLRVVCDPAHRTLPPAAAIALDARGGIGLLRVAASVIADPSQLPDLIALARDAARARRALVRRVRELRTRF